MKAIALVILFLGAAAAQSTDLGFDYLWGPTFCSFNNCNNQPVAEFTIHGLWPNYASGGYPENCDPSDKFSTKNIPTTLLNQMGCEWVSYTGTNAGFWSYEWGKHGTCALSLFPTQEDYFDASIDLNNKYEATQALEASNIDPATASTQPISTLQNAFKSAWGVPAVCAQYYPSANDDDGSGTTSGGSGGGGGGFLPNSAAVSTISTNWMSGLMGIAMSALTVAFNMLS
ncbi:hypothetical protein KSW81_005279 [Nannochloris sp. 'desiccata']|nr:hypothetical protein KSW81_005279 [Chlorella desiccata (nom. nud.)]